MQNISFGFHIISSFHDCNDVPFQLQDIVSDIDRIMLISIIDHVGVVKIESRVALLSIFGQSTSRRDDFLIMIRFSHDTMGRDYAIAS